MRKQLQYGCLQFILGTYILMMGASGTPATAAASPPSLTLALSKLLLGTVLLPSLVTLVLEQYLARQVTDEEAALHGSPQPGQQQLQASTAAATTGGSDNDAGNGGKDQAGKVGRTREVFVMERSGSSSSSTACLVKEAVALSSIPTSSSRERVTTGTSSGTSGTNIPSTSCSGDNAAPGQEVASDEVGGADAFQGGQGTRDQGSFGRSSAAAGRGDHEAALGGYLSPTRNNHNSSNHARATGGGAAGGRWDGGPYTMRFQMPGAPGAYPAAAAAGGRGGGSMRGVPLGEAAEYETILPPPPASAIAAATGRAVPLSGYAPASTRAAGGAAVPASSAAALAGAAPAAATDADTAEIYQALMTNLAANPSLENALRYYNPAGPTLHPHAPPRPRPLNLENVLHIMLRAQDDVAQGRVPPSACLYRSPLRHHFVSAKVRKRGGV